MKTIFADMTRGIDEQMISRAGRILLDGGLVAFPTETVYGLGGNALDAEASGRIYAAKGRPSDNPLIVHIAEFADLQKIVRSVPETAVILGRAFWPGPLTMILDKNETVPQATTGGLDTVAVRMPDHPVARALIRAGGGYVAAPSANTSGRPSPTKAEHVAEDLDGKIDMIIDGGPVGIGLESTIIDLTEGQPVILRPGYVTRERLEQILGRVETDRAIIAPDSGTAPKAPGMKYRHYAPKGSLTIVEGEREAVIAYINARTRECREKGIRTGVICTDETCRCYTADSVKSAGARTSEETIASRLFRILREFDDENTQVMFSESFGGGGLGQAIMNRLMKAAGHKIVQV